MTGCEESNAASNDQQITPDTQSESKAEVKPIESNEIKQVLDSVNALGSQIKAISNRQETNADKLNQVTEEISDFKASSNLYDWISWAVAAIALLTAIIALINFNSVKKRFIEGTLSPLGPNHIRLSWSLSKKAFFESLQQRPAGGSTIRPEGVVIG